MPFVGPQVAPPPEGTMTPLCHCGSRAVWQRQRLWCGTDKGEGVSADGSGLSSADEGEAFESVFCCREGYATRVAVPRGCGFELSVAVLADPPEPELISTATVAAGVYV